MNITVTRVICPNCAVAFDVGTPHADQPATVPMQHYIAALDVAGMLWSVVANVSGGDWSNQSSTWQTAAIKWRDNYHTELNRCRELHVD